MSAVINIVFVDKPQKNQPVLLKPEMNRPFLVLLAENPNEEYFKKGEYRLNNGVKVSLSHDICRVYCSNTDKVVRLAILSPEWSANKDCQPIAYCFMKKKGTPGVPSEYIQRGISRQRMRSYELTFENYEMMLDIATNKLTVRDSTRYDDNQLGLSAMLLKIELELKTMELQIKREAMFKYKAMLKKELEPKAIELQIQREVTLKQESIALELEQDARDSTNQQESMFFELKQKVKALKSKREERLVKLESLELKQEIMSLERRGRVLQDETTMVKVKEKIQKPNTWLFLAPAVSARLNGVEDAIPSSPSSSGEDSFYADQPSTPQSPQ